MAVIESARQTVAAPVAKPRRFGLFSVVNPIDGGDQHWIVGGLTADGEECSQPLAGQINCGPSPAKQARSWFSDIEGDPWLTYMYETCKTVGRYAEAAGKLRTRFLAAEQSAVEEGLRQHVLVNAPTQPAIGNTIASAIGALEANAADQYGGQIILHMSPIGAAEAARFNLLTREGDHLETVGGSLVSVGNYGDEDQGNIATVYATGALDLYRGDLVESGPLFDFQGLHNDYYALVERAYAAVIDCFWAQALVPLCPCGGSGGPI